jgi:hypothetical protein
MLVEHAVLSIGGAADGRALGKPQESGRVTRHDTLLRRRPPADNAHMELPFEVNGPLPEEWAKDLAAYASALAGHPWGGTSLKRLVIGEVDASLREWMPAERYERWRAAQSVRSVITGAIAFVAKDGLRTAVVPPFKERLLFLHFPGHEMVEAVLDERQEAEGYEFVDGTHWGAAHVVWTEYVVERTRRRICNELGWGYSALDNGGLPEHVREFETNLEVLVKWAAEHGADPMESHQHFFELARVYAMSRGRADAGSPTDEEQFPAFFEETFGNELQPQWRALDAVLADAYEQPSLSTQELDELVHDDGWRALYEEYRSIWRYLVRTQPTADADE